MNEPAQDSGSHAVHGARTGVGGTAYPVDVSADRRVRGTWLVLLAGPVVGLSHFMLVYLVAEAGCTGSGTGLRVFDPPVPEVVTVATTVVAAVACLAVAAIGYRRWRRTEDGIGRGDVAGDAESLDRRQALGLAGFLLSSFFFVVVVFVGAPAPFLAPC